MDTHSLVPRLQTSGLAGWGRLMPSQVCVCPCVCVCVHVPVCVCVCGCVSSRGTCVLPRSLGIRKPSELMIGVAFSWKYCLC